MEDEVICDVLCVFGVRRMSGALLLVVPRRSWQRGISYTFEESQLVTLVCRYPIETQTAISVLFNRKHRPALA